MTVRVLIVDDSSFFRKRLSEIISSDPLLSVVGLAENGREAIEQVKKLQPDVITMDIEMPIMNGINAVKEIMVTHPTPILMLSTWSTDGAKETLDALEAGAVDYMPKRFEDISSDSSIAHRALCKRLCKLANSKVASLSITPKKKISPPAISAEEKSFNLVVIGTSTGGPIALQKALTLLPADFPYPLLIIQHMPASFTPSFAERLNSQCKIHIKHAADGDTLIAGTAYLAPGGTQMLLRGTGLKRYIEIQAGQESQIYRPCIDTTLESLTQQSPKKILTVILTGMGSDGLIGCQKLKELDGTIWAQDEKSSTIYGMPKAVVEAGIVDKVLDIIDIGHHLAGLK
ncbi:chemotaxis response regulator protein-glutamate methylesterase [Pseudomonadota bacterium]|nr:chemotaxis response regulator protein-glutamate methylesterase [Pseudomonadota bacterium]